MYNIYMAKYEGLLALDNEDSSQAFAALNH